MGRIRASVPPLRGIVHAAGVLDDGVLSNLTWERLVNVMAPKLAGAWNLHAATLDVPLDFFVLFSSAASVLGSPGQGNYAAANAFLDSLAHHRHALGLTGTSVNWGPWDVGMASGAAPNGQGPGARMGIGRIAPADGLAVFGRTIEQPAPQLIVVPIDWRAVGEQLLGRPAPPLLAECLGGTGRSVAVESARLRRELVQELRVTRPDRRPGLLVAKITEHVARVLDLGPEERPSRNRPLVDLGLDSLMAVELSNVVARTTGIDVPATALFDYPTIDALARFVLDALMPTDGPPPSADDERKHLLADIEGLTDAEAAALLDRSLESFLPGRAPNP